VMTLCLSVHKAAAITDQSRIWKFYINSTLDELEQMGNIKHHPGNISIKINCEMIG